MRSAHGISIPSTRERAASPMVILSMPSPCGSEARLPCCRGQILAEILAAGALHSEEHLAASDRGVVMFRRLLRQQIEAVQAGRDPLGVTFDPARATVTVEAGNFILEPA
jgi:hypothetical protein